MRVERCWFWVDSSTTLLLLEGELGTGGGNTARENTKYHSAVCELLGPSS